ncbi:2'-5' RNA ligase family protein [Streptomyces diastatochromogenes]|uniref:2'-5' RNA ligase family protein n=1 Tax=Streptomyces diastatochromogenes TaxID=42236 RepID=UPI002F269FE9
MPDASPHRFQAGRTGLIVRIPEAEPAVSAWRERFDPSARAGVPAHVTVVFPFLDGSRVQGHIHRALAEVLGGHHAFDVRFARCERFPGVLYLAPEPDAPLRRLTEAVAERWPEAPPYGGAFTEVLPHLTVADGQDDTVLTEVETALHTELPFTARVSSVDLMVHDGVKWQLQATFDLPASPRPARE